MFVDPGFGSSGRVGKTACMIDFAIRSATRGSGTLQGYLHSDNDTLFGQVDCFRVVGQIGGLFEIPAPIR